MKLRKIKGEIDKNKKNLSLRTKVTHASVQQNFEVHQLVLILHLLEDHCTMLLLHLVIPNMDIAPIKKFSSNKSSNKKAKKYSKYG